MQLTVNGSKNTLDIDEDTPLLWAVRDELGLTGTKFGCGKGLCGACTVHVDGVAVRSCITPAAAMGDSEITTIEGLSSEEEDRHIVQQAWIAEDVPQCGYCQSGMIMAVVALLKQNPNPSDEDINSGITNICRCGSYTRIRKAIHLAASMQQKALQGEGKQNV